jgi:hypothetical protein
MTLRGRSGLSEMENEPETYNAKVGLALFCPLASRVKGYSCSERFSAFDYGLTAALLLQ